MEIHEEKPTKASKEDYRKVNIMEIPKEEPMKSSKADYGKVNTVEIPEEEPMKASCAPLTKEIKSCYTEDINHG